RARRDRRAPRARLPEGERAHRRDGERAARGGGAAVAHAGAGAPRRGGVRAPHRVPEPRQPAARAGAPPAQGAGAAHRARRRPRPAGAPARHREPGARAVLRRGGGVLGVLLAVGLLPLLARLVPPWLPIAATPAMDLRVLGVAAGATVFAALVFGVVPALRACGRIDPESLRDGARAGAGA